LRGYCEITITAVLVIVSVLLVMNGRANGKAYEVLTLTRSEGLLHVADGVHGFPAG
jgi:hypothetical protein